MSPFSARRLTRHAIALCLGFLVALALAELHFRADERAFDYLWSSERRFVTRGGQPGPSALRFQPASPTPGPNIVVLGDSMAWGTTTPERAWPALLAEFRGIPVHNLAHYGYDARQSAAAFAELGRSLHPSVVLYAAYTNDAIRTQVINVGTGRVWVGEGGLWPLLRPYSALLRRTEGAILPVMSEPDWSFYERALRSMGGVVVVGMVPWVLARPQACAPLRVACAEEHARVEQIRAITHKLDLPYIETLTALQNCDAPLAPADPTDWQHPNDAGHRCIARHVAAALPP